VPSSQLRLSPYRLSIFRQCRRRYRFHYVEGLYQQYRKAWPHFTMGDHVHSALKQFFSHSNQDRTFEALERMLRRRWRNNREGFASTEEEREWGTRAIEQLRWFCDTQDLSAQPYLLEAQHEVTLSRELSLLCKIDRVDLQPDGSFHVVDYKTGHTGREVDCFQLLAYAVLLRRRYGVVVSRASYLFLNGEGWHSVEPMAGDLDRTEADLRAASEEIISERDYLPRPGRLCHWCDFLGLCDAPASLGPLSVEDEPTF
jgi:putative RecB family exonuclease